MPTARKVRSTGTHTPGSARHWPIEALAAAETNGASVAVHWFTVLTASRNASSAPFSSTLESVVSTTPTMTAEATAVMATQHQHHKPQLRTVAARLARREGE